jgi:hypothetical protein
LRGSHRERLHGDETLAEIGRSHNVSGMENMSKLFDTVIKAPLWFFFAATMACGIPLLNLEPLTRVGVTSDIKLFDLPLALYALLSFSLFASSAIARSSMPILCIFVYWFERLIWRRKLRILPDESRAILAYLEEQAEDKIYYNPKTEAVSLLRDANIFDLVSKSEIGDGWGLFSLTYEYKQACHRHYGMFRAMLKNSDDATRQVREAIREARGIIRA